MIANVRAADAERMRGYGAKETIDRRAVALPDAVRQAHPDGVDVLIDLVDADVAGFAALASLVRPGGTAMSTNYVADEAGLRASGVTGINFALPISTSYWNGWQRRSLTAASSLHQSLGSPWKKCPLP